MNADAMVDTNVLVYAASRSPEHAEKARVANRLIGEVSFGISTQVLQEFLNAATKKTRSHATLADALAWLDAFVQVPCVPVDTALVRHGVSIATAYGITHWDGAILAAAHALNAPVLYTEDLNHGQRYGAVQVVNPFRPN